VRQRTARVGRVLGRARGGGVHQRRCRSTRPLLSVCRHTYLCAALCVHGRHVFHQHLQAVHHVLRELRGTRAKPRERVRDTLPRGASSQSGRPTRGAGALTQEKHARRAQLCLSSCVWGAARRVGASAAAWTGGAASLTVLGAHEGAQGGLTSGCLPRSSLSFLLSASTSTAAVAMCVHGVLG